MDGARSGIGMGNGVGRRISLLVAVALLATSPLGAGAGGKAPFPFDTAAVRFEQNATDEDVEVVFEVTGGAEGLAALEVVGPDGRTVAEFRAPEASTLGLRHFLLESPEPKDVAGLKAAYPEGVYTFSGSTVSGLAFHGESRLSHELPGTVSFLRPGSDPVSVAGLEIAWTPVDGVAAYVLEIEQDELDVKLNVRLPGSATSFSVPDGFLVPGMDYQMGVGTLTEAGNVSVVETEFSTAE